MILAFTLTMPGCGSWNGHWTGEGRLYVVTRTFRGAGSVAQRARSRCGDYSYAWSDGWRANVQVREVDASEAARLRRKSRGFCGYEWMIDSLIHSGKIEPPGRDAP